MQPKHHIADDALDAGFVARLSSFLQRPARLMADRVDSMKMTALGAWAANELGNRGADCVEILWTPGDAAIEVSASFLGEGVFKARAEDESKRDRAVMSAVSRIIDDRIEAWSFARLPGTAGEPWWRVLEVSPEAGVDAVRNAYRAKAKTAHPDLGGSHEVMARLNRAMDDAEKVLH